VLKAFLLCFPTRSGLFVVNCQPRRIAWPEDPFIAPAQCSLSYVMEALTSTAAKNCPAHQDRVTCSKRNLYLKDICHRDCYNEQAYLLHLAASIYVPDSDLLSQNCHTFDSACLFGDLAEGESQDWIWEKAISWNAYLMKRSTCS
jgi:hypothetical protein